VHFAEPGALEVRRAEDQVRHRLVGRLTGTDGDQGGRPRRAGVISGDTGGAGGS
jgi:hypothetical protein